MLTCKRAPGYAGHAAQASDAEGRQAGVWIGAAPEASAAARGQLCLSGRGRGQYQPRQRRDRSRGAASRPTHGASLQRQRAKGPAPASQRQVREGKLGMYSPAPCSIAAPCSSHMRLLHRPPHQSPMPSPAQPQPGGSPPTHPLPLQPPLSPCSSGSLGQGGPEPCGPGAAVADSAASGQAAPRSRGRSRERSRSPVARRHSSGSSLSTVHICGLPAGTPEAVVRRMLAAFGPVTSMTLVPAGPAAPRVSELLGKGAAGDHHSACGPGLDRLTSVCSNVLRADLCLCCIR